jgi:hypothetical protein
LISRSLNHAAIVVAAHGAAALTFSASPRLLVSATSKNAGSDVKEGSIPMTFASKLSIVTAYVAFAFVAAIVLGML